MRHSEYNRVCYLTEQHEENVALRNTHTGTVGYTLGCTYEGGTIQVRLADGSLDSWGREECSVMPPEEGRIMTMIRECEPCIGRMD